MRPSYPFEALQKGSGVGRAFFVGGQGHHVDHDFDTVLGSLTRSRHVIEG
jgi:hypothetical protein